MYASLVQMVFRNCFVLLLLQCGFVAECQAQTKQVAEQQVLFSSDEILEIVISGDVRTLLKDRYKKSSLHALTLSYTSREDLPISIPVKMKTRGHFRKKKSNCRYPPLAIHFPKGDTLDTGIFSASHKLKLVMPCVGDEYVVREWLVYKLYNLFTANSFKARLVKIELQQNDSNKGNDTMLGFLLEEETQLAARNNAVITSRKISPLMADNYSFLTMAVFQYMIGNTDWSIQYLQNIKLLLPVPSGIPIPVPYDFDHAGLVDAPYAHPAEELRMRSIRERRYRGYCLNSMDDLNVIFELFNEIKSEVYAIYSSCSLIDERYKKKTIEFLDDFYSTINNSDKARKDFLYPCDKNGTGNIIIKGLRED